MNIPLYLRIALLLLTGPSIYNAYAANLANPISDAALQNDGPLLNDASHGDPQRAAPVTNANDHVESLNGDVHSSSNDGGHGSDGEHGNDTNHRKSHGIHVVEVDFQHVQKHLIIILFMIAVVICKIGFHKANFLSSWMPESCVLIILGTLVGVILHLTRADTSSFYYIQPDIFFLVLLPPCILEASYSLHDNVFFANIGTIILYAVVGTILNCFFIGPLLYGLGMIGAMGSFTVTVGDVTTEVTLIQCLVFASLIVAVDPVAVLAIFQEIGVNDVLYFLVFGESLLNDDPRGIRVHEILCPWLQMAYHCFGGEPDAVTVVLYKTMRTFSEMEDSIPASQIFLAFAAFFTVSLGGLAIGIVFGIVSALITRFTQHVRVVEPLAMFSLAYGSYLTAELFHFSGIIGMIGCGLIQRQYAFHNISNNSATTIKYFSKMLSCACDSIIFLFLGIALVRDDHAWNTGFVLWTTLLCLLARFAATFGLTYIANKLYRQRKVNLQEQFIMSYGGLRGAVAFCLVAMLEKEMIPAKNMFQTTTLFIIIFTVFVQGMSIKPMVKWLRIKGGDEKVLSMFQEINQQLTDHILVFMEEVGGHLGHNTLKEKLYMIDKQYFKPVLQRDPLTRDELIMEMYQNILMQQQYENLYGCDSPNGSLAILPAYDLVRTSDKDTNALIQKSLRASALSSLANTARSVMAAQRMTPRRISMMSPSDEFELRQSQTVPAAPSNAARPSIFRLFSIREGSVDAGGARGTGTPRESAAAGGGKQRGSVISKLWGTQEDVLVESPTVVDLKRWLIKPPERDIYQRRHDRNLKNDEETDLVHHLQELTRRHDRYKQSQSSYAYASQAASPYEQRSRAGSFDQELGGGLGEFKNASTPYVGDDRPPQPRQRHKTVDTEGPQGHVKYTPRYRTKQKAYRNTLADSSLPTKQQQQQQRERLASEPQTSHRNSTPGGAAEIQFIDEASEPLAGLPGGVPSPPGGAQISASKAVGEGRQPADERTGLLTSDADVSPSRGRLTRQDAGVKPK